MRWRVLAMRVPTAIRPGRRYESRDVVLARRDRRRGRHASEPDGQVTMRAPGTFRAAYDSAAAAGALILIGLRVISTTSATCAPSAFSDQVSSPLSGSCSAIASVRGPTGRALVLAKARLTLPMSPLRRAQPGWAACAWIWDDGSLPQPLGRSPRGEEHDGCGYQERKPSSGAWLDVGPGGWRPIRLSAPECLGHPLLIGRPWTRGASFDRLLV
jgi:hypothetical protein